MAGEMAKLLKSYTAPAENPHSVLSTHSGDPRPPVSFTPGTPNTSGFHGDLHSHVSMATVDTQ